MKRKKIAAAILAVIAIFAVVFIFFGDAIRNVVIKEDVPEGIMYFAHGNLDPNDDIPQKDSDMYFGYNRWRAAQEAVANGEATSEVEWIIADLFHSIEVDPALAAAIALEVDQLQITPDNPILQPELSLRIGERADAAHLRFISVDGDWTIAVNRIEGILGGSDVQVEIKELNNYTSAMYMVPLQLEGDKPSVVVRNSNNVGGHFVVFSILLKDGSRVELKLRLECGYQPVDVPDWPVPDIPDEPDPTPTPTPTPEPKDPADDPQNRPGAEDYDFYSPDRVNHDPDTTETDEPVSPTQPYVAPQAPVVTPTPTQPTVTPTPTVPPGTDVETGPSQPPLEDIADPTNPNKPDVDPALAGDPVNTGEVTNFE
ncbi:MAG: hypothetical protein MJ154_01195 [Candidatus Saccharibacteria bacterium]|nr:hypothetical protein [Candidatus Saccharibacteria bacterium]